MHPEFKRFAWPSGQAGRIPPRKRKIAAAPVIRLSPPSVHVMPFELLALMTNRSKLTDYQSSATGLIKTPQHYLATNSFCRALPVQSTTLT